MAKPVILFESYPDFNGSSLEVYKELLKRGYGEKYDMIWAVYDNFNLPTNMPIVKFFPTKSGSTRSAYAESILARTKCILDSNRYIKKTRNAYRFHLRHGCSLKNSASYNQNIGDLDAILTTSPEVLALDKKLFPSSIHNKFVITGMPATDRLFEPANLYENGLINELTGSATKFNKIIGWLPTFRDHRFAHYGKNRFQYGIPAIHNIDEFNATNDVLNSNNTLLIIQMHHAQAHNYDALPKASNIVCIGEPIKAKYNIATTDLLGNCDALLTDYSSAYHEYIILNRPIGLCIEDLPDYATHNGFICFYPDWIKGDYLLTNKHLNKWITGIANGADRHKSEREVSLHKIHQYIDNHATQRVVDYLVKEAKL